MAPVPRDIYEDDVDFAALAAQDPAFAKRYWTLVSREQYSGRLADLLQG
jgi:hypothetical protein